MDGAEEACDVCELLFPFLRPPGESVGDCEAFRARRLPRGLDGFGEDTIISSSIVSFAGLRSFGMVNGLKKSLMLLFLGSSFFTGGIANAA